jgi:hypothetical protein
MSDDLPAARPVAPVVQRPGSAATALREALEAVKAHQQAAQAVQAEALRREEARGRLIEAHQERDRAVHAEAKALLRLVPRHHTTLWSPAERAQAKAAMRAAAAVRLNLTLGELPPVPAPAPPPKRPKLQLTPFQRRVLIAAQARAVKVGQTLLPEGFQLVRPYNKKARPVEAKKRAVASGGRRRGAAAPEEPRAVTVSPAGAWSISEDGLE